MNRGFAAAAGARRRLRCRAAAHALQVYSTLEVANIADFKKAFEAENRDLEIVWIRDSTGVVTARSSPSRGAARRRDLGAGRHLDHAAQGARPARALRAQEAAAAQAELPRPADPPPMSAWKAGSPRCASTPSRRRSFGLPSRNRGSTCSSRSFKGKITMPHPASSGTGYFHVSAWIQMFGEDKAWAFMDRLHDNIAFYVHSGSQPCKLAAAGEFPLGISAEISAADARTRARRSRAADEGGRRLGDGHRGDPARHAEPRGGQRLMDFRRLAQGQRALRHLRQPGRHAGIASTIPGYPAGVAESMIKNDFAWASANRARILAEWTGATRARRSARTEVPRRREPMRGGAR
jgi:iron(III) transport system substrate-binding protein